MHDATDTERRALLSGGASADPIYAMVRRALVERNVASGTLLDIGCGHGRLLPHVRDRCTRYIGADVVHYPELPGETEFFPIDLDTGRVPLDDSVIDVVAAVETIEHLENPRAFMREVTRLCKPGGWMLVTTPNQLSFLSKLTLVVKNKFNAFTDSSYPAHLTALLEVDLRRIAAECGWGDVAILFSRQGRMPGTARSWPAFLSRLLPRALSDNVCVVGRKT